LDEALRLAALHIRQAGLRGQRLWRVTGEVRRSRLLEIRTDGTARQYGHSGSEQAAGRSAHDAHRYSAGEGSGRGAPIGALRRENKSISTGITIGIRTGARRIPPTITSVVAATATLAASTKATSFARAETRLLLLSRKGITRLKLNAGAFQSPFQCITIW
jgi:hypothetical protein